MSYEYNLAGNMTRQTYPSGRALTSNYDGAGRLTRTFVYDSLSRLTSATNPESGTISYQYDGNGNLTQKSDSRGTITYAYDALNRVMSRSYTDGTPAVSLVYDAAAVAFSKGRLTSVTSSVSSYGYDEYDALGRVRRSSQLTNGTQYSFTYGYNLADGLTSQTYPSGKVVTVAYDPAGRPITVADANRTYASQIAYAAHGPVSVLKLGNNLWEHTLFNDRLQPIRIGLGTTSTSTSVLGLDYGYGTTNNNGNVLSQTITAPGFSTSQTYNYDALNRLGQAMEAGSWTQTYGHDQYGNHWVLTGSYMLNPTLTPQAPSDFNPNNNRLAASGYDAAGNQTLDAAGRTFGYDLENRQTSFSAGGQTTSYAYDGEGRRVKKTESGVTTIFVYDAFGKLAAEYSNGLPSGSAGTTYLTTDHLGSTRVVTDAAGTVRRCYDYLPFGEGIPASQGGRSSVACYGGSDTTRQLFTSKERDAESGLDYFGARYMSAAHGRFLSPDPKEFSTRTIENPEKWNKYSYVLNNPLAAIDPDGKEEIKITVRAFIPASSFRFPPIIGPTWRGDGRQFDPTSTSYRAQSVITIETDPNVRANPIISAVGDTSGSAVDWWGLSSSQAVADVKISALGVRDAQGNPIVNVSLAASDPLVPGAPPAAAAFTITSPAAGGQLSVKGSITPYPAWEMYANVKGGDTTRVLGVMPSPSTNTPAALLFGMSQRFSAWTLIPRPKPPEDCRKLGTCKEPDQQ